jgi:superfamily II DNA or RNA helicase
MIIPIYISDRIYIPRIPELTETLEKIRQQFTYANPKYIQLKRLNKWTGGIERSVTLAMNVVHPQLDECISVPRGGIEKVRAVFAQTQHELTYIDQRLSLEPITNFYNDIELRPDQKRLVRAMLKQQNCLIRSPTASGKTESSLKLIEYILKDAGPVLVIVWETDLMNEWRERAAKRFGLNQSDIGQIGGSKKKIAPITIGMQQTLRNYALKIRHKFGGIIADEVQRFAASTYQQVIDVFPAKYRIGISADETRHDKNEFFIYDMFGEVADEIKKASLIDKGSIHDVVVRIVPTNYNYQIKDPVTDELVDWASADSDLKNFNDLLDDLCYDEARNQLCWEFMEPSIKLGHSIMIATRRVEHAIWWDTFLRSKGVKCGLMLGGLDYRAEFDNTKKNLRNGNLQAGIGTMQKIGQGLDIPRWDRGFILTPCAKNKQQFEQLIGRLRRTHPDKKDAICYYMYDELLYPSDHKAIRKNNRYVELYENGQFMKV